MVRLLVLANRWFVATLAGHSAQAAPLLPRGRHPYPRVGAPPVAPRRLRHQRHAAPCTRRSAITPGCSAAVVTLWPIGPGSIGQIDRAHRNQHLWPAFHGLAF